MILRSSQGLGLTPLSIKVTFLQIPLISTSRLLTIRDIGFNFVISLAGNAILADQPAMIDAAIAGTGGAVHFYPSEYGADLTQPALQKVRYFKDKNATRRHIEAKGEEFKGKGFHYTYLLTGSFTDWSASDFFGVDQEKKTVKTYGSADAIINNTSSDE
jgi:hypothetical protein